jgi:hypothetical protein
MVSLLSNNGSFWCTSHLQAWWPSASSGLRTLYRVMGFPKLWSVVMCFFFEFVAVGVKCCCSCSNFFF